MVESPLTSKFMPTKSTRKSSSPIPWRPLTSTLHEATDGVENFATSTPGCIACHLPGRLLYSLLNASMARVDTGRNNDWPPEAIIRLSTDITALSKQLGLLRRTSLIHPACGTQWTE